MRASAFLPVLSVGLISLVSAQTCKHKAVGSNPAGNPTIAPAVGQVIKHGEPFEITWTKTTEGDVSILLLQGPSTNVQPYRCIVDSIPNTGKYTWTPPADIPDQKTHYGLQIVVDKTGQFQYSPQFGISGGKKSESSSYKDEETSSSKSSASTTKHAHTASSLTLPNKAVQVTSTPNVTSVVGHTTLHLTGGTGTAPHPSAGTGIAPYASAGTGTVSAIHKNSTMSLSYHHKTRTNIVVKTGAAATNSEPTSAAATATASGPVVQSSNVAVAANAVATQAGLALAGLWGVAVLAM